MKFTTLSLAMAAFVPVSLAQFVDYQPVELKSSNGKLNVTLTVDLVQSLNGIVWSDVGYRSAPGYNGAPIGPTLRVKAGDVLTVTLRNQLAPSPPRDHQLNQYVLDPKSNDVNVTVIYNRLSSIGNLGPPAFGLWGFNFMNLHFHGMDFSPKEENLRTHVDGGQSKTYTLKVPDNKEPGLYWYHNHVHGTAAYSYMASLFGMIIVEGTTTNDVVNAVGVKGAKEICMILSDGVVNPDGTVPPSFPVFANFNWTGVTNGNMGDNTTYRVTQGETVLFRVASATTEATLRLSIPNTNFVLLANDGLVLPKPEATRVVAIPGGGRAEFAARMDTPGTYVMKRAAWSPSFPNLAACKEGGFPFYPCWSFDKEQVVATIVVTAKAGYVAPTQNLVDAIVLPKVSPRLSTLAIVKPAASKLFVFKMATSYPIFQIPYNGPFVPPGVGFGVNSRLLTPNYIEGSVRAGTCETWTVVSDPPGMEHPFHMHQAHFLVQAIDGVPQTSPKWHDTIYIQQNATLHICFDRAEAGDVLMAHCHMPNHFDIGMGAMYNVTAALPAVASLDLINARTDQKVSTLRNGSVINRRDVSSLRTPAFNINATLTGSARSVEYWYNNGRYRIEEAAPFAFCSNKNSDFFRCRKLGCGTHTVKAVPYARPSGLGEPGTALTVTFTIQCDTSDPGTPSDPSPIGSVSSFRLMNAINDKTVVTLTNTTTVSVADIAGMVTPSFSIQAVTTESVDAVRFFYNSEASSRMDRQDPFAFCPNNGADFVACPQLSCGPHTVTAVPYFRGNAGTPYVTSFVISCSK